MNSHTAGEVIAFLESYNDYYRELIVFLLKKHEKIMADDLAWMLDSLPDEQALVMRAKSLETKRIQLFKALGIAGKKADEIVAESPDELRAKTELVCGELEKLVFEVKRINAMTTEIVEKKLEGQQKFVEKAGLINRPRTYNVAGGTVAAKPESLIIGDF